MTTSLENSSKQTEPKDHMLVIGNLYRGYCMLVLDAQKIYVGRKKRRQGGEHTTHGKNS